MQRTNRAVSRLLTTALITASLVLPVGTALPTPASAGVPAPTITSFAPTEGVFSGGTSVVIAGTNLTGATAVTFGDAPAASFTVDSSTQITAVTPSHAIGSVDVKVTRGSTITAVDQFVYQPDITLLHDYGDFGDPSSLWPFLLVDGPDGNIWASTFAAGGDNGTILKLLSDGTSVTYTAPAPIDSIQSIVAGTDGNLWATAADSTSPGNYRHLLRITPDGTFTEFTNAALCDARYVITGGDGNLWLMNDSTCGTETYNAVRVTTDGSFTVFPVEDGSSNPSLSFGFMNALEGSRIMISTTDGPVYLLDTSDGDVEVFTPCKRDPGSPLQALNGLIGPDDRLWVTCFDTESNLVTPSGYLARVTLRPSDNDNSPISFYGSAQVPALGLPFFMSIGSDGNIWVSQLVGPPPDGSPLPFDPTAQLLRISFPDDFNTPVIEDFDSDIFFMLSLAAAADGYMYADQFTLYAYYVQFYFGPMSEILGNCFNNNSPECESIGIENFNSLGGIFRIDVGTAPAPTIEEPTVEVTTPGTGSIDLQWQAPDRTGAGPIQSYRIKYSTNANMSGATMIDTGDTDLSFTLSSLPTGTYYVRIATTNSIGTGTYSQLRTVVIAEPPAAPSEVVVTPGNGSATIAFTPGDDGGAPITKYQYKVGRGAWTDALGTTSPITISGLTNYEVSAIRIRAVNLAGPGASSAPVQVWPRRTGTSLSSVVSIGTSGLRARIAALTVPGGAASHYWVHAYTKGTDTVVSSCRSTAAVRSCNLTGLTAGTEYDVTVRGFFTLTGSPVVLPTLDSARQTIRVRS